MIKPPDILHAKNLGALIDLAAATAIDGVVVGKTSKGVFLKFTSDRIIFITTLPFRGPLTINIQETNDPLKSIEIGMKAKIGGGQVFFPGLALTIQTQQAEIWDSPIPREKPRSDPSRLETAHLAAGEITTQARMSGLHEISTLVEMIVSCNDNQSKKLSIPNQQIYGFIKGLKKRGVKKDFSAELSLLGHGEGLTPAGDDVILGFALTLNRWKRILLPERDLRSFNQKVIRESYKRTTTLSANLIACAIYGQADEKLINALDMIVCEMLFDKTTLGVARNWGSSSGNYALIGILGAILMR